MTGFTMQTWRGPVLFAGPRRPLEEGVHELLPAQLPRAVCKAGLLTSTSVGPLGGRPTDLVPSFLTSLMALQVLPTLPKQFAQPVGQWITLKVPLRGGWVGSGLLWAPGPGHFCPYWWGALLCLLHFLGQSNTIEIFELLFYLSKANRLRNMSSI